MKYFYNIILAGLLVHVLPLSAEDAQTEEMNSLTPIAVVAESREFDLEATEEELSLLEKEIEEFQDELSLSDDAYLEMENMLPFIGLQEPSLAEVQEEKVIAAEIQAEKVAPEETQKSEAVAAEASSPPALMQEEVAAFPVIMPVATEEPAFLESPSETKEEQFAIELATDENTQTTENTAALEISSEPQQTALAEEALEKDIPATYNVAAASMVEKPAPIKSEAISVDLNQAFSGAPIIYSLLLAMSIFSVCIWLYSILSMRASARVSKSLLNSVHNKLNSNNFDDVLVLCEENKGLFCKMLSTGIHSRRHGLPVILEAMKAEGKRSTVSFWQKIGLLNDIAIVAPMLGLLGTVLGMFYAFYDVNRSMESISTLFDGLGVSVGTTVAGLIVAILALILHSTAKYRLVRTLNDVENEAQNVAVLIEDRTSIHRG